MLDSFNLTVLNTFRFHLLLCTNWLLSLSDALYIMYCTLIRFSVDIHKQTEIIHLFNINHRFVFVTAKLTTYLNSIFKEIDLMEKHTLLVGRIELLASDSKMVCIQVIMSTAKWQCHSTNKPNPNYDATGRSISLLNWFHYHT